MKKSEFNFGEINHFWQIIWPILRDEYKIPHEYMDFCQGLMEFMPNSLRGKMPISSSFSTGYDCADFIYSLFFPSIKGLSKRGNFRQKVLNVLEEVKNTPIPEEESPEDPENLKLQLLSALRKNLELQEDNSKLREEIRELEEKVEALERAATEAISLLRKF